MSFGMKLTDAYDLMSKKIIINKMSIENLNNQISFSESSIQLQTMAISIAKKKVELIERLNEIFEQQLKEFCPVRQQDCQNLYDEINELDEMPAAYNKLLQECQHYE